MKAALFLPVAADLQKKVRKKTKNALFSISLLPPTDRKTEKDAVTPGCDLEPGERRTEFSPEGHPADCLHQSQPGGDQETFHCVGVFFIRVPSIR